MASDRAAAWHLAHRAGEPSFVAQALAVTAALPPGPVLDLGCGSGALLPFVETGRNAWYGLELDPAMARAALRRPPPVRVARADAARLPYRDGSFGSVVALGLFEYVADPVAVLREARRVTAGDGIILLAVPRRDSLYRRGLAALAPLVRGPSRPDPFDLRSGRRVHPSDAVRWARRSGLRLEAVRSVAPAVLPWPLDRLVPAAARSLAGSASPSFGSVWLFRFTCPWPNIGGE